MSDTLQFLPFLFVLVPFIFMGGIIALIIFLHKKSAAARAARAREMTTAAAHLNWSFVPQSQLNFFPQHEQYHLFSLGHTKEIRNLMHGERDGARVAVFDYMYVTGHGKSRSEATQTVVLLESAQINLPFFSLRPENFMHRIAGAFGYQDIDFAHRPAFNDRYLLRGSDETQIRWAFTNDVLAYYEVLPGLSTDGGGQRLVCYRENVKVETAQLPAFVDWGVGMLKLFRHAW
ncbi:MAG: hypothetical protein H0T45_09145 [Pyrinomonadaceae bacterium]|nr:hypothetical protein [Pyrinomonadaceae bacterium]MDQ3135195.1 hypothetical protein [Acidobacteriota bacterium]